MYCTGIVSEIMRFYALIIHAIESRRAAPEFSDKRRTSWIITRRLMEFARASRERT